MSVEQEILALEATWGVAPLRVRKNTTSRFAHGGLPNPLPAAGFRNPAGAEVILLQTLRGDLQTVSRVTADDWIGVAPTGAVMSKADLLEMLSSHPAPFESAVYDQVQFYLYGQTAVVISLFRGEGKDIKFEQRFMRVYANRDGQWQCVATQIVPIPEQARTSV